MKKIFLIFIFFIFFTTIANTASFNWTKYNNDVDGTTEWYYDKKSILKVGSYKFYWILTNNLGDIKDGEYSTINHHMVNCDTFETKWITYTGFNSPMGRGGVTVDFIIPEDVPEAFKWEYFDPVDTIYGGLMDIVCKTR